MENQKNGRYEEKRRTSSAEELYDKWVAFVSRMFRAMTAKERFLAVVAFVLTGIVTYFAAEKGIPFLSAEAGGGISKPLGDALLCASGTYAPAAYLALLYAARQSGVDLIPRILALTSLFAVRTGINLRARNVDGFFRGFYRENATVKVGSAALFSLLCVGIRMVTQPLTLETLPEILTILLLTPALTALLCGAFADKGAIHTVNHRKLAEIGNEFSTYIFFALCVYVAGGRTFVGSSLASLVAIFLTVVTAAKGGIVRGGFVGAVLGLIISVKYAPILTVIGIFAGTLSGLGVAASVGISCAAGCLVAVYAYGYGAFLTYVPECIIATAVTSPVLKYGFLSEDFPFRGKRVGRRNGTVSLDRDGKSVSACADTLYRVSDVFNGLSQISAEGKKCEGTLNVPDSDYVCEQLKKGFCDICPLVCICWDNGGKVASGAVKRHVLELYAPRGKCGNQSELEIKERFKCIRPGEIKQEIIRICETPEARMAVIPPPPIGFAEDCLCVSEILRDIAVYTESETSLDTAATARARRAVSSLGIAAEEIAVFGDRRKTVVLYGADTEAVNGKKERLTAVLSKACGQELSEPMGISDGTDGGGGQRRHRMIFEPISPYTVSYACAEKRASGEERNGDSAACLTTQNGYFYAVICDGMGSGADASDCSENAVKTLKTLLESGISPALSVKLTGNVVKDRCDECFTTLDLLAIDTETGEACIYKSGAACSFLLRNGDVRYLAAPSLPLGISYETEPEDIPLLLQDGDVLVMISDGVAEEEKDEFRISERISLIRDSEPQKIADKLLAEAMADSAKGERGAKRDDMTVAVVKFQRLGGGS